MSSHAAELRRRGIAAREALTSEARERLSRAACGHILRLPEFESARRVLIYNAVRAELSLAPLDPSPGKLMLYPCCTAPGVMEAYDPAGGWRRGPFGIREPDPELCSIVAPDEIDLVICPCTTFDANGRRIGMGGGYYDRYLPRLTHARILCAAFEAQRSSSISPEPHDFTVHAVVTELGVFPAQN